MRGLISVFRCAAACALVCASCGTQGPASGGPGLQFVVVDVGEGLSQIATSGGEAVVFDMGDTGASKQWMEAYGRLGAPHIRTIVISHSHVDHMGGLRALPDSLRFSGDIAASMFEDTALIRSACGSWASRVRFRTIARGDTVALPGGSAALCLWPPRNQPLQPPLLDDDKNTYSLCFLARYQSSSVLITSDIDTTAEQELAARYGFGLMADILVVPHHGSGGSVSPVFYGYVAPSIGIISCAAQNAYGHPAATVLSMLFQMHVALHQTALEGTITAFTNGYYWTAAGENSY
jgi:competence protein ComEC